MRLSWEGWVPNRRFWSAGGRRPSQMFSVIKQSQAYAGGEARRLRSLPRTCGRDLFSGS